MVTMKKISPVWLWYSIIFIGLPPFNFIHEWGHVIIALVTGAGVKQMLWEKVITMNSNGQSYQFLWEFSPFIFLGCILIWLYLIRDDLRSHMIVYSGEGEIGRT
jgi:hypothetical protein